MRFGKAFQARRFIQQNTDGIFQTTQTIPIPFRRFDDFEIIVKVEWPIVISRHHIPRTTAHKYKLSGNSLFF